MTTRRRRGRIRAPINWLAGLLLMALCAAPARASAQRGQDGEIAGTVRDESGAALPEASVTATSPALIGGARTVRGTADGRYRLPVLAPGTYKLEVTHPGFTTVRRSGLIVPPGVGITVDVALPVAGVAEAIEVAAPVPVMDVRTAASPTLIDRRLIDDLPLARDVVTYVGLVPGVIRATALGGTAQANPLTVDGASGNDPAYARPTTPLARTWIDELQIVGPGSDARYGESTGLTLNVVTRAGTNQVSGLGEFWSAVPRWTGSNTGDSLTPAQAAQFRPLEVLERWEAIAQAGGPLRRDRVWLFGGVLRYRDDVRTAGFSALPRTPDEPYASVTEHRGIGKVTAAPAAAVRLEGYLARFAHDGQNLDAGPLVAPEAMSSRDRDDYLWNARLTWAGPRGMLVDVRHGGNDRSTVFGPPTERWSGPPGHFDSALGSISGNALGFQDWESRVGTTSVAVSAFLVRGRGTHDLRAGLEHERASITDHSGYPGNMVILENDGTPYEAELWNGAIYRGRHRRTSLYAQDLWGVGPALTLEAGLRVQFARATPPYPVDFATRGLAPRLGAAWDVGGRHDTVVRLHYGRTHDAVASGFYDWMDPLSREPFITAAIVGPGEYREIARSVDATRLSHAADLRPSYVDEGLAGLERAVGARMTIKAQYLRRHFGDVLSFVDPTSVWAPVAVPDPGPDGRRDTADDAPPLTVFANTTVATASRVFSNPPTAWRRYDALQLILTRRTSGAWGAHAAYTWSRTRGNAGQQPASNAGWGDNSYFNSPFANPNKMLNTEGRTGSDARHGVTAFGTARVPGWGGWTVSGVYRLDSGVAWARRLIALGLPQGSENILAEPRVRRMPAFGTLDVRLEKTLRVRRTTLGLYVDVFNATNTGVALQNIAQSGPRFGWPLNWSEPRTARIGTRVQF